MDRIGNGVAVIEVDGEHDLNNAPRFRDEVERLQAERAAVVVDLAKATFVDSSMLAALLDARRRAEEKDLGFAVNLPEDSEVGVRRVIEVTGLDAALPILPDRDGAIEHATTGTTG